MNREQTEQLIEVRRNSMKYNGACYRCGKKQAGNAPQPLVVWIKRRGAKRGENHPVCCLECADMTIAAVKHAWNVRDLYLGRFGTTRIGGDFYV